jgi:hypothetical protein
MKLRPAYIFVFLLAAIPAIPAVASDAAIVKLEGKKFTTAPTNHIVSTATTAVALRSVPDFPNTAGKQNNDKKYFKVAPDVAMHGSVAQACDAFLNLIAIIHLESSEAFPPTVDGPGQQVLFRVLFSVIISPNAP